MAFVDAHGATTGGVHGYANVTHRRFEPIEQDLLPRGPAWDPEDPIRRQLIASQCTELSRVDVRAEDLLRELYPPTTHQLIGDWEVELGLPECGAPETLEARRAAVVAKLLAEPGHNQGKLWWQDALEALGYPPQFFLQAQDVLDVNDDCIDDLFDEQWMFVWGVYVWPGVDDALFKCFVAHNALLATYVDAHVMWQPVVVDETVELYGVTSTSDGFLVAVGSAAASLHAGAEYDEPDGWALGTPDPDDQEQLYAVASIDSVLVACGVNPTNFYRSVDHGATWESTGTATAEMYAITGGIGAGVAIAAGEDGNCWRTFDYGATWAAGTTITGAPIVQGLTRCGNGVDVLAVVACAQDGGIYRTPNSGTLWTNPYTAPRPLYGISGWLLVVVAVGDDGFIARSTDGGLTWASVTSPTSASLRAVVGTPVGRWTAVGVGGVIVQSLDDGVTWTLQPSPTTEDLRAVTRHVTSNRAVIVGENTTIILE